LLPLSKAKADFDHSQGDLNRSLASALQAMRVWCRASANLARLSGAETKAAPPATESATLTSVVSDPNAPLPEHPPTSTRKRTVVSTGPHASLSWQLAEVSSCLFGDELWLTPSLAGSRRRHPACRYSLLDSRDTKSCRALRRWSDGFRQGYGLDKTYGEGARCSDGGQAARWQPRGSRNGSGTDWWSAWLGESTPFL